MSEDDFCSKCGTRLKYIVCMGDTVCPECDYDTQEERMDKLHEKIVEELNKGKRK